MCKNSVIGEIGNFGIQFAKIGVGATKKSFNTISNLMSRKSSSTS